MAFDIAIDPNDTGLPARYWRVTSVHIDHLRAAVSVWLHGWADALARSKGRAPAASLTLQLSAADFPAGLHTADTAAVYAAVKAAARANDGLQRAAAIPGAPAAAAVLADARDC